MHWNETAENWWYKYTYFGTAFDHGLSEDQLKIIYLNQLNGILKLDQKLLDTIQRWNSLQPLPNRNRIRPDHSRQTQCEYSDDHSCCCISKRPIHNNVIIMVAVIIYKQNTFDIIRAHPIFSFSTSVRLLFTSFRFGFGVAWVNGRCTILNACRE